MTKEILLNNQLFKVTAMIEKTGQKIFAKHGLTVKNFSILVAIENGVSKNSDLSKVISGTPSAIAQKTKILEDKNFLKRTIDQKDRRIFHFYLTKKGKKILMKIMPDYEKSICKLWKFLDRDEITRLLEIFKKVEKRLVFAEKNGLVIKILQKIF